MKLDDEPYIDQEVCATNIHRLQRFALILPVVHAASIVIFWPYRVGATDTQEVWRNGIHQAALAGSESLHLCKKICMSKRPRSRGLYYCV